MLKELDQWRSEYRRNTTELRERQSSNTTGSGDSDVLQLQLAELDADIKESSDAIAATKASILLNEQKLRTLIASIGNST
jgi:DNA repair ATPase RecN